MHPLLVIKMAMQDETSLLCVQLLFYVNLIQERLIALDEFLSFLQSFADYFKLGIRC